MNFELSEIYVKRLKNGKPSTHPLHGDELRALRKLKRIAGEAPYVFMNERKTPFTPSGFAKVLERSGRDAGFEFKIHPHMLRHACGYNFANQGKTTRAIQKWLGHKNIGVTMMYTELATDHFKDW